MTYQSNGGLVDEESKISHFLSAYTGLSSYFLLVVTDTPISLHRQLSLSTTALLLAMSPHPPSPQWQMYLPKTQNWPYYFPVYHSPWFSSATGMESEILSLTCGHLLTSPLTNLLLPLCALATPNFSNRVGNSLKGRSYAHHVSSTVSRSRVGQKVVAQIRRLQSNCNGTFTFLSSLFPFIGFWPTKQLWLEEKVIWTDCQ